MEMNQERRAMERVMSWLDWLGGVSGEEHTLEKDQSKSSEVNDEELSIEGRKALF